MGSQSQTRLSDCAHNGMPQVLSALAVALSLKYPAKVIHFGDAHSEPLHSYESFCLNREMCLRSGMDLVDSEILSASANSNLFVTC